MSSRSKITDSTFWLKVTAYIFETSLSGVCSTTAISNAAIKFDVSVDDIMTNVTF